MSFWGILSILLVKKYTYIPFQAQIQLVSIVLQKSFRFFMINVFLEENFKLSRWQSGKWLGQSCLNESAPRKGEFGELKCKKFPGGACPRQTSLEVRNQSVFILDPHLVLHGKLAFPYAVLVTHWSFFFLFYLYLYILGSIPLDPSLAQSLEEGKSFMDIFPNSPTLSALSEITNKLLEMDKSVNT